MCSFSVTCADGDAVHDGPVPVMEDVLEAITKHIKGYQAVK